MTARIPPELKESYAKRRVPMRRYGDAEEVAQSEWEQLLQPWLFLIWFSSDCQHLPACLVIPEWYDNTSRWRHDNPTYMIHFTRVAAVASVLESPNP